MNTTHFFRLLTCFAGIYLLQSVNCRAQRHQVGDIVENFTLTNRATGQPVSLQDLEGKIIFLEWFAYWCPFCQAAAADVRDGIVEYYNSRGGNPEGVPVMHVGVNLEQNNVSSTKNFISFYGFQLVLNDFNRLVANRFQSGGQPIFAIINGVENSPSHQQWELVYTRLGYGDFSQPIDEFRAAINSVSAAETVSGYEKYLKDSNIPEDQSGLTDDPDFDGILNIFEYLAGTGALDTASYFRPEVRIITMNGNHYQALEYLQNSEANDLTIAVQFSDSPDFSSLNVSVPYSRDDMGNGLERVVVRSGNVVSVEAEFCRLFVATQETQN